MDEEARIEEILQRVELGTEKVYTAEEISKSLELEGEND